MSEICSIYPNSTLPMPFQNHALQSVPKIQVSYGFENTFVNQARQMFTGVHKALFWNSLLSSGGISNSTVRRVTAFLQQNNLSNVQVNVNSYDPIGNAKRVFSNPKTGLISKCTFGIASSLIYTAFLNKYFGLFPDYYDFTSNTIHLYSNDPDLALLEGAKAAAYSEGGAPSIYAFKEWCPLLDLAFYPLHQEDQLHRATSYVCQNESPEACKRAWSVMAPRDRIFYALYVIGDKVAIGTDSKGYLATRFISSMQKRQFSRSTIQLVETYLLSVTTFLAVIACHLSGR